LLLPAYGVPTLLVTLLTEHLLEDGLDLTTNPADEANKVLLLVFPESSEPESEGAGLAL